MRAQFEPLLKVVQTVDVADLPSVIGALAEIMATAQARLCAPAAQSRSDELLDVAQAAARLHCSKDFLYRNHKRLPFTRADKIGRKVLFSSVGIDSYLKRAR